MLERHAHWLGYLACFGLIQTVITVFAGQFHGPDHLSPVANTISAYAATDPMGVVQFGILTAGVSSLALVAALRGLRAPLSTPAMIALLVWSVGITVAALVPATAHEVPVPVPGYLHRGATSVSFIALLTGAGLLTAGIRAHPQWSDLYRPLRVLLAVSVLAAAAVGYVLYFADRALIGLLERGLGAATFAMLILVSVRLVRLSRAADARRARLATATERREPLPPWRSVLNTRRDTRLAGDGRPDRDESTGSHSAR